MPRLLLALSLLFQTTLQAPTEQPLHPRAAAANLSTTTSSGTTIVDGTLWITNGTFLAHENGTTATLPDGTPLPVVTTPSQARPYIANVTRNSALFWSGFNATFGAAFALRHGWTTLEMAIGPQLASHPWAKASSPDAPNAHFGDFWGNVSLAFAESLADANHTEIHVVLRPPRGLDGGPRGDGRVYGGSVFGRVEWPALQGAGIAVFAMHPTALDAARARETYQLSPRDDVRLWQRSGGAVAENVNVTCANPEAKVVVYCKNGGGDEDGVAVCGGGGGAASQLVLPQGGYCDYSLAETGGGREVRFTRSDDAEAGVLCLNSDPCEEL